MTENFMEDVKNKDRFGLHYNIDENVTKKFKSNLQYYIMDWIKSEGIESKIFLQFKLLCDSLL